MEALPDGAITGDELGLLALAQIAHRVDSIGGELCLQRLPHAPDDADRFWPQEAFHIVFTDGRDHPKDLAPTWFGHSIGKWDGDTLMVDTVGFNNKTRVDTEGHPHTEALHVVEHFRRTDANHIAYDVTITDPGAYTRPWKNVRTFTLRPDWEIMEYNCEENNKDVNEGHIK